LSCPSPPRAPLVPVPCTTLSFVLVPCTTLSFVLPHVFMLSNLGSGDICTSIESSLSPCLGRLLFFFFLFVPLNVRPLPSIHDQCRRRLRGGEMIPIHYRG
jgi:hypothetical protein